MIKIFYLLLIFLMIGFHGSTQDLREMRLVGEAQKSDSEIVTRRDNNGNLTAAIMVISDMDGFSYDAFNGVIGNVDARPGMDIVYLQTTERVLEIYKTGYRPLKIILADEGIRLRPQEVWQITVAGDELINALPVVIRFTPDDAVLYINNTRADRANTYSLALGQHNLRIEKEGFQPVERTITVNEQNIFFEYTLQRQPDAGLQIETTPAGATVYLDDVSLGQTPLAAFYKPGIYPIRIVKEGYVTLENQTLEVALPQTRKSYTLEENVGWLTVNTHSGASVYLNDQLIANPKNVKLPPQLVRVKVSMPKAESLEQQVILKRNDRLTLDMFPEVQTATLQIAVTPFDANIELTGDAGEKYSAVGMKIFEDIPVGSYTIKVSAGGYETVQETMTLRQGSRESRSIRLSESQPAAPAATTKTTDHQKLKIGDRAHGGIVFYLDGKGGGLVCAEEDQIKRAKWGCRRKNIGAIGKEIGAGVDNTAKIVAACELNIAATICNDLVINGYSDWFLPSKDELNLMYQNLKKYGIGNFAGSFYWSSSEYSSNNAWNQYFDNGSQKYSNKSNGFRVRAVRAFETSNKIESQPKPGSTVFNDFGIEMVFVKGGSFTMGCTAEQGSDCMDIEKPAHQVTVSDFYIGKYEVTQKQWMEIMGSNFNYSIFKNCDDCPAENMGLNHIQEFIRKLNQKTGKKYRLPTEAEWEYAARGGANGSSTKYAGSNNIDEVAWYSSNSGGKTHPVGRKKANELGIYDMSGNVLEWCEDDWHRNYNGLPYDGSAWIDSPRSIYRVLRGGSWGDSKQHCRVSSRHQYGPGLRVDSDYGFRLAHPDD
jgi:formylglycine-generating enzyme required for sulfatase activity